MTAPHRFILTLSCADRIGIVAEVSRFLAEHACNIVESGQFEDAASGRFFLRTAFDAPPGLAQESLQLGFAPIAAKFAMAARFYRWGERVRTLLMVSRLGHCMNDLLYRHRSGSLEIDIVMVVSNHADFEHLVRREGIPFHLLPVTQENKATQESALQELIAAADVELVVLGRYMQILSDDFCGKYPGRIINIHHSLLPSFKGAKPYHRAHERGVKLIGATAHYVTADLDEGPIIEQDTQRVRHNFSADDLVSIGRQIESKVLSTAVEWHAQRRVLLNGLRTVVFQ